MFDSFNNMDSYICFPNENTKKIYSFPGKILKRILPMKDNIFNTITDTIVRCYNIININVTIIEVKVYKNFLKNLASGYQFELSIYDHLEVLCLAEKFSDDRIIEFLYVYIQSQINFQLSCNILEKKFSILKQYDRLKKIALNTIVGKFQSLYIFFSCNTKPLDNPAIIEYCNVPYHVILEILKYDKLSIDSENSVVGFVMFWINYDKENTSSKTFYHIFVLIVCIVIIFFQYFPNYLLLWEKISQQKHFHTIQKFFPKNGILILHKKYPINVFPILLKLLLYVTMF